MVRVSGVQDWKRRAVEGEGEQSDQKKKLLLFMDDLYSPAPYLFLWLSVKNWYGKQEL